MSERRGVRRQAREAALQALFTCDFHNTWSAEAAEFCLDHFAVPRLARGYASQLATGVAQNLAKIDSRLTASSEHWSVTRMSRVDRVILRVAVFEMFYLADVPLSVAIDEAVEIAKRFGAEESPMFVNGVLDRAASTLKQKVQVEKLPVPRAVSDGEELPDLPALVANGDLEEELPEQRSKVPAR